MAVGSGLEDGRDFGLEEGLTSAALEALSFLLSSCAFS